MRSNAKKVSQIESNEIGANPAETIAPDTTEATLMSETSNRNGEDDIQNQSLGKNGTMNVDYIEPMNESIESEDVGRVNSDTVLDHNNSNPSTTNTGVDPLFDISAEIINSETSTTGSQMKNVSDELRNKQSSNGK